MGGGLVMTHFTVKQIADILKVSKTTVQKAIKANNIKFSFVERNKQFYSYEKAASIIKSIREDFDFSELENSKAETANCFENSQTKLENSQTSKDDELAALNRLIDIVQQQLIEKDKQLEIKDKQIKDLSDRLAEAMQLTQGQQFIAAADKTKQLMDSQQQGNDNIEEKLQQPKKGIFARIFSKQ